MIFSKLIKSLCNNKTQTKKQNGKEEFRNVPIVPNYIFNLLKSKYRLINIDDSVINTYKETVKGNKNTDVELATLKINRDYYCGRKVFEDNRTLIKHYGYLSIVYNKKKNKIVRIKNPTSNSVWIDYELRNKLNQLYGIKE